MLDKVYITAGFSRYVKTGDVVEVKVPGKDTPEKHEKERQERFFIKQEVEVDGVSVTQEDAADWIEKGLASETPPAK